jgi:hypothetical protein
LNQELPDGGFFLLPTFRRMYDANRLRQKAITMGGNHDDINGFNAKDFITDQDITVVEKLYCLLI